MFMYTLSLMIGTAGLPHVIMRFFTVPTVKDARSSAGWALVFIAILYTTAPAVAAMAKLNLHRTVNARRRDEGHGDLYAPRTPHQVRERPDWMKRWEKTGLLKFEDKNGDGRIQYYNDKTKNECGQGQGRSDAGWKGNELTVNADIIVLANPEIALLPNWVIALVAAGGLAAALSTAAGLLMAISSAVSHDLIKGVFARHQRKERADGWQDLDGGRHRDGRLPGA
jgi:cation/acetate symporter